MGADVAAPARDLERALPFAQATRGIFDLALDGLLWSRRSLVVGVMLGLPVLFGLVYRLALVAKLPPEVSGFDLYGAVVVSYVRFFLPLAALFYATALIADEVEGKTITYLFTRPIARAPILVGKFAAYLVTTLCLAVPAAVLTFFLLLTARGFSGIGASVPDLFRDVGVMALALLAYGALFTLFGVLLRRPLIAGLLFLFVWELVANLPGYMPRFTLTAYLRSLIRHRPAQEGFAEMFGQVLPAALCLGTLAALTAVFLGLAIWIFSRREYVLEQ